ncbi:MAG: preprotein translocase subunit SecG [Treponema sp.]|nr:preprotein translocase subunit SecG [Treponema sp.]
MGAIKIVLLVAFVIVCALLILFVAIQDDGENGMGGLLGGRGTAAFGSHSASVLTKTTSVLVVLFFVFAFGLALVNKQPKALKSISDETEVTSEAAENVESNSEWWTNTETSTEPSASETTETTAE